MFVQFSDTAETSITSYFTSAQDAADWTNLGEVDANDSRWKAFYNAQIPQVQAILPLPA